LKPGTISRDIVRLRERLGAEGYESAPVNNPAAFDASLERALRRFQVQHDLKETGMVDARVLAALEVSPAERLATIDANLERWRWMPRALEPDRLEVNIAAARLTVFQNGEPALAMRTIVGDPTHHTPMFVAHATGVVINPPWNVPPSIAYKELFPRQARDPGFFRRNEFSLVGGSLRQAAGDKSALGRLKIDLDDPYTIYLHDTPERRLFALDDRARSHGCVRLERPLDLTTWLLRGQGLSRADIETAIAARVTRHISLKVRPTVYLVYWTAAASPDGTVAFHHDVYGWDARLLDALKTAGSVVPAS